ncbi:hypothetical protein [Kineococcus sp. SYSU DK005]|uniref:hypothetical protein n=1 Tax=Kineococcus sp. SYSU DK005 TaxID=3383126 RepID=UPI003D7EFD70
MRYNLTVQPLNADGVPIEVPTEEDHPDLFEALESAHQQLRSAREAGASIHADVMEWTITYPDGEGATFLITPTNADSDDSSA